MDHLKIRRIQPQEYPVLEDFLYHAIFLPPGAEPLPWEIIYEPEIFIYIKDFGNQDDCGVVAEDNGKIVGAAWTRIIPAYGHVDNQTPELAISILPGWRGKSIGSRMMRYLFDLLRERGYRQTSLSVQKDNPAVRFYERLGYTMTGEREDHAGHEDYIMIKDLQKEKEDMNNEIKTINDFDLNMICEYYSNVERQGPGSPEITLKALSFIEGLTGKSKIADIGCGTGGQTMTLAQNTPGHITGVDFFPGFIRIFNQNAQNKNLQDSMKGMVGDMKNLSFCEEEFDLIWSEGAIYNIGFERGLNEWRKFLKPGGYIAVSEMSWFTEKRPAEIQEYIQQVEPGTDTISNKVAQMQKAGYIPIATFVLPETCWTDHFFAPQVAVQEAFLKENAGNRAAEEFIAGERYEKAMYDKYKAYYGYAFYIGKKIE